MKNKYLKIALVALLCVAMILPYVSMDFADVSASSNYSGAAIESAYAGSGVKLSVLGDSISTYYGVSNDTSANSTIGNNKAFYTETRDDVRLEYNYFVTRRDTWWQQAADTLDMDLLVNNSWSGSYVFQDGSDKGLDGSSTATAAWKDRCVQLHDDTGTNAGTNPDIIAIYLGTNDMKAHTGISTFAAHQDAMIKEGEDTSDTDFAYAFSKYIRMVYKTKEMYSDAEIYLFTLLPHEGQNQKNRKAMEQYNQSIRDLVTYYQGQGEEIYLVDLYNDSGITSDLSLIDRYLGNSLHPNAEGMDCITNCFVSSILANSKYYNSSKFKTVEYDLNDVFVDGGNVGVVRISTSNDGDPQYPFTISLLPTQPEYDMEVKVEWYYWGADPDPANTVEDIGWYDITSWAYSGGTIHLDAVYASYYGVALRITAKAVYETHDYRWEQKDGVLESVAVDGVDHHVSGGIDTNDTTVKSGSYGDSGFVDALFGLDEPVILRNEEPWVLEWKASGSVGGILFSGYSNSETRNNTYIYWSNGGKRVSIGYRNDRAPRHENFAADITSLAETNVYRLVNTVASDGTNTVCLYLNDQQIGTMDNYYQGNTAQDTTDDWVTGKDLRFKFLGSENYLLHGTIEYVQVWEGGDFNTARLRQLIEEYDMELSVSMADATGFDAYRTAVENAKAYLNEPKTGDVNQDKYDALTAAILEARNQLAQTATATKIYSIERIAKDYVPIGMPTGLSIVTSPDVTKIQVGNTALDLLTYSSKLQTMKIDGVETQVKVWFVTWNRTYTTQAVVEYRVHAYTTDLTTSAVSELIAVPYGPDCLTDLKITVQPDKTVYRPGESFDATGMEVTAYYGDGSTSKVVTGYTVDKTVLSVSDEYVVVTYDDATYGRLSVIQPIKVLTDVSELGQIANGISVTIRGRYVGVASEGLGGDEEVLIKDMVTDDIIAVRGVPGDFPGHGYGYGYTVNIIGTIQVDGTSSTPNKRYLEFSYRNGDVDDTIVSRATYMEYVIDDVIEVSSWEEFQALFQVGVIEEYSYIKFTGPLYFQNYKGSDTMNHRIHMVSDATSSSDIRPDGKRSVCLRADMLNANLGTAWKDYFLSVDLEGTEFPGSQWNGELIALYTGANGSYFQLNVLSTSWIDVNVSQVNDHVAGTTVNLNGYYVGVADEGLNSDKEVLIKDLETDDIIAVRGVSGTFPNYGYSVGDQVSINGTVQVDGSDSTPNKYYVQYSANNGSAAATVVSGGNDISYQLDDVITVSSWEEFQALFQVGVIEEYSYIKFSGAVYFQNHISETDGTNHRIHMNSSAAEASDIKSDGRAVCLRADMMTKNLGKYWQSDFPGVDFSDTSYPGTVWNGEMIALYTGANGTYFQLNILDESWIAPAEA